jgi:hypothetical protein
MDPFAGMKGLTRNPLGIIAIFLGVLYGIAGLLLGTDSGPLTQHNQTLLTWLVFIFPFVSLLVFAWLVAKHHGKLYAPADYRSDEAFLGRARPQSEQDARQKIETEIELQVIESSDNSPESGSVSELAVTREVEKNPENTPSKGRANSRGLSLRTDYYLGESLALDQLERDLGVSIQRRVTIESGGSKLSVDGIVKNSDNSYVIDVIAVQAVGSVEKLARIFAGVVSGHRANLIKFLGSNFQVIFVVANIDASKTEENFRKSLQRVPKVFDEQGIEAVEVKFYSLADLRAKRGLA